MWSKKTADAVGSMMLIHHGSRQRQIMTLYRNACRESTEKRSSTGSGSEFYCIASRLKGGQWCDETRRVETTGECVHQRSCEDASVVLVRNDATPTTNKQIKSKWTASERGSCDDDCISDEMRSGLLSVTDKTLRWRSRRNATGSQQAVKCSKYLLRSAYIRM